MLIFKSGLEKHRPPSVYILMLSARRHEHSSRLAKRHISMDEIVFYLDKVCQAT